MTRLDPTRLGAARRVPGAPIPIRVRSHPVIQLRRAATINKAMSLSQLLNMLRASNKANKATSIYIHTYTVGGLYTGEEGNPTDIFDCIVGVYK